MNRVGRFLRLMKAVLLVTLIGGEKHQGLVALNLRSTRKEESEVYEAANMSRTVIAHNVLKWPLSA